ncbi:MAG TPA: class I SAM-dependent methyltransferase [Anaerolineae bacterium]|nr:class I SAM-dependent methyltransferase [Anaerolineae bacterium]
MNTSPTLNDHSDRVALAFSRKADEYDAFGDDHLNLARMRRKVYDHVLRFLQPADRLLELNAGTGIDAAFFARRGQIVHAIDIAPGMLDHLAAKIDQQKLSDRLTLQTLSFTELNRVEGAPFDYILSNFGGLNCIDDLTLVTRHLSQVLRPGGIVTWVIMPRVCPWEMALLLKGKFKIATRRWSRHGTLTNVEGVRFITTYFTPHQVMTALGPNFRLQRLEGLSVFAPPADRVDFPRRFPRLYRMLVNIDDALAPHAPFNHWGDFLILTAQAASHD